jgi:glycosyltransferase involved in cell wall biosynthesis
MFPRNTKSSFEFYIRDILGFRKLMASGKIKKYDVVHINDWENFIQYKKENPNQVSIAESHAFHLGLDLRKGLADSEWWKKTAVYSLGGPVFHSLTKKNIKKFDIYYVAIPNLLETAKTIREDAIWLPNPIDTDIFHNSINKFEVQGDPAIFFPTRIHRMKEPDKGFDMFFKIKKHFPNAKLHLIKYPDRFCQYNLYKSYLDKLKKDIVWHSFVDRKDLPKFYSSFDLVLGAFGKGLLNLVELEAMACKATVLTYDRYEFVKKELHELPDLGIKLLSDNKFKKRYSLKSYEYVTNVHGIKNVCKIHEKNIKSVQ